MAAAAALALVLASPVDAAAPPGATARCNDGMFSYSQTHSGTCSHHGGVAQWLAAGPAPAVAPTAAAGLVVANATRTPGAFNPAVRQATIRVTICVSGWTATVRPSSSYTGRLKLTQMLQYGERGSPSSYEEDHLVPLELGGAPSSPLNLWPEPRPRASAVDTIENRLHREVCAGTATLAAARAEISRIKHTQG